MRRHRRALSFCTVWAEPPELNGALDMIEGTGYHWCSGPWARHKLIGRLQRKQALILWVTEATANSYWEYDDHEIMVYPAFDCENDGKTTWRNRSTGYVVAEDGRTSEKSHNSERNITVYCGG